jgi:hypothetical protein
MEAKGQRSYHHISTVSNKKKPTNKTQKLRSASYFRFSTTPYQITCPLKGFSSQYNNIASALQWSNPNEQRREQRESDNHAYDYRCRYDDSNLHEHLQAY